MKKILSIIILFLFVCFFTVTDCFCAVNKQINANIKTKRVPAGTVIPLKMLDPVSSNSSLTGQQFALMVMDNVKVDNTVVIPQGSLIRGTVDAVQAPKMLYKGGIIRLYFDHIVSSTGKQVSFYGSICNNPYATFDGALSSQTTFSDAFNKTTENTKNIVVKSANWGWQKGGEMFNGTPKYVLSPITTILSMPVAGVYFVGDTIFDVFKKGENIFINQGDVIQVKLLKPLDMPVY